MSHVVRRSKKYGIKPENQWDSLLTQLASGQSIRQTLPKLGIKYKEYLHHKRTNKDFRLSLEQAIEERAEQLNDLHYYKHVTPLVNESVSNMEGIELKDHLTRASIVEKITKVVESQKKADAPSKYGGEKHKLDVGGSVSVNISHNPEDLKMLNQLFSGSISQDGRIENSNTDVLCEYKKLKEA